MLSNVVHAVEAEIRLGLNQRSSVSPPSIASRLGMSTRSLQRKLAQYDTSVSQLVNSVRRDLAMALLIEGNMRVDEIGLRIGYDDPKTVFRAFRRWTGTSPRRVKATPILDHDRQSATEIRTSAPQTDGLP
jgi:AraC-like DNA-binding protein